MAAYSHPLSVRVLETSFAFAGEAQLGKIAAPTLVLIAGENTQTHAQGEKLAELIPDARLLRVPDAHHLLNMDNPTFFNYAILDFLQG